MTVIGDGKRAKRGLQAIIRTIVPYKVIVRP